jgi:hypothetical protein
MPGPSILRRLIPLVLLTSGILASPGGNLVGATPNPAPACAPTIRAAVMPILPGTPYLWGVGGSAANDVWGVGQVFSGPAIETLAEHWDGVSWSVVPTPNGPLDAATLHGVAAISPQDAWAVGLAYGAAGSFTTFALHWDGATWSVVPTPSPLSHSELLAAWATATDDVWAVGDSWDVGTHTQFLIEHWDGSAWSVVAFPPMGIVDQLRSLSGTSSSDVWAVGASDLRQVALHWDGTRWTSVAVPSPGEFNQGLYDVSALAPDDVWAVGYSEEVAQTITVWDRWHWDGTAWTTAPDDPGGSMEPLFPTTVAALASGDAWAFGVGNDTSVDHFDGESRSRLQSNGLDQGIHPSDAMAIDRSVWMVGVQSDRWITHAARVCPISITDHGSSPASAPIDAGEQAFWSVASGDASTHEVVDASGMGLFESGPLEPGRSFSYPFIGAGTYPITDGAHRSRVLVSFHPSPSHGSITTTFHIQWASAASLPGLRYDVQIARPGSRFVDWLVNQGADEADFVPDAGAGTYQFRARVRSVAAGGHSGWSPVASIVVS